MSCANVRLKSGDQTRNFGFGIAPTQSIFTTTNQDSFPLYKEAVYSTFQALIRGTGAVSATVTLRVSNDDDTGRGYILGGRTAPGLLLNTTNASNSLSSPLGDFTADVVGATVEVEGVPEGTTITSVTNAYTAIMSANATATSTSPRQGNLYANNWCTTALGTITLTGTDTASDGFATASSWRYVKAVVSAISGVGARVSVNMGV